VDNCVIGGEQNQCAADARNRKTEIDDDDLLMMCPKLLPTMVRGTAMARVCCSGQGRNWCFCRVCPEFAGEFTSE
jgi:hypothetical protein